MIWLASFPRSGNTFFRNVLFEVYGIQSSTYHKDPNRKVDPNYTSYKVVKTHLLPHQLEPKDSNIPAVYIVRDGRDALVSLAHHRKDIVEPGTDFENNLLECLVAKGGSHFGGWSQNVLQWSERAHIIIKFEDLIEDPIREVEKLRQIMDLPPPQEDKLPNFESLKFGRPQYGGGQADKFDSKRNKSHFRKGKIGGYQDEMSMDIQRLFWGQHGKAMEILNIQPPKDILSRSPYRVLIEGSKYFTPHMDGVSRYVHALAKFLPVLLEKQKNWEIDLLHKNSIIPILRAQKEKDGNPEHLVLEYGYEKFLLGVKSYIKKILPQIIYQPLRNVFIQGPWRRILRSVRKRVSNRKIHQLKESLSEKNVNYDLIHVPLPQHLDHVGRLGKKVITTVHDITHDNLPHYHQQENVEKSKEGFRKLETNNSQIIAVSTHTSKDLLENYKIDSNRVDVIHEGIDPDFFHKRWRSEKLAGRDKRYNIPSSRIILSLSTLEPRKNIVGTMKAFEMYKRDHPSTDVALLIAGKKGWKWDEIIKTYDSIQSDIHFTGYIDDEDLAYVYSRADVFCFPSFYEGFGLPILEAMGCGTPVIYGDNSAMKEIAGDVGLPVDPDDYEQIAEAMHQLLDNEEEWISKSEQSWRHANNFTWLKTALQTVRSYEKAIKR